MFNRFIKQAKLITKLAEKERKGHVQCHLVTIPWPLVMREGNTAGVFDHALYKEGGSAVSTSGLQSNSYPSNKEQTNAISAEFTQH